LTILIHVGPPKSGTSAIQKWLTENTQSLKNAGVFYPSHLTDANGVSSGNLLSLFEHNLKGELKFSKEKKRKLLSDFNESNASTLLLSSEFFFRQLDLLSEEFPEAKFIAYLRFPIEVIESSYNQGVKRHFEIKKLGLPEKPKTFQLNILENYIKNIGKDRFILRPYHKKCYVGGTLVSDFTELLNIEELGVDSSLKDDRINNSYSLDALEFKRWFNQFNLRELQPLLDSFLQQYSAGKDGYSLVPAKIYRRYQSEYINVLQSFCRKYDVRNSDIFLDSCEQLVQKPFLKQDITDDDFESLLKTFLKSKQDLQIVLYREIIENDWKKHVAKYPQRLKIVLRNIEFYVKCKVYILKVLAKLRY